MVSVPKRSALESSGPELDDDVQSFGTGGHPLGCIAIEVGNRPRGCVTNTVLYGTVADNITLARNIMTVSCSHQSLHRDYIPGDIPGHVVACLCNGTHHTRRVAGRTLCLREAPLTTVPCRDQHGTEIRISF